jgi:ribosomal protein S18 acetylase RimI-like enzyme
MKQHAGHGIVTMHGLADVDRAAVVQLAALCNKREGLDLPFNLDGAGPGHGQAVNQVLYYRYGELIGFVSLEGGQPIEVCGMVHPAHRRKGIGRALLAAAQAECRRRGLHSLLLVCDEAARSGRAFVAAVGAQYCFAEYRMVLDRAGISRPQPRPDALQLRPATTEDAGALASLIAASFGDPEDEVWQRVVQWLQEPSRRFYMATVHGDKPIGSLGAAGFGPQVYITAFGVLPEHRGRGYGRQMLVDTIDLLLAQNWQQVLIEVETENRNALSLYQSCGFKEAATYGFYHLEIDTVPRWAPESAACASL